MTKPTDIRAAAEGRKPDPAEPDTGTRMIVMGSTALTEGFTLIGFETWPDATPETLDELLDSLLSQHCGAFVVMDQALAKSDSALLETVREEGGRVVVIEVPPLCNPGGFHLALDDQVSALTGGRSLDD